MLTYETARACAEVAMNLNGEGRAELSTLELSLVEKFCVYNEVDDYSFVAYDHAGLTFLIGEDGEFFLINTETSAVYYVETESSAGDEDGDEMLVELFKGE